MAVGQAFAIERTLDLLSRHRRSANRRLDCMSPPQNEATHPRCCDEGYPDGRVEPQTRRASRGSSYRGLCRNRYVKIAQRNGHCRWRPWRRGTVSRGVSCYGGSDPKAGGKACSEMLSSDVLLRSRADGIWPLQTAQEPRP